MPPEHTFRASRVLLFVGVIVISAGLWSALIAAYDLSTGNPLINHTRFGEPRQAPLADLVLLLFGGVMMVALGIPLLMAGRNCRVEILPDSLRIINFRGGVAFSAKWPEIETLTEQVDGNGKPYYVLAAHGQVVRLDSRYAFHTDFPKVIRTHAPQLNPVGAFDA